MVYIFGSMFANGCCSIINAVTQEADDLSSEVYAGMADSAAAFYDQLSDDYHLIFMDWRASVQRQAGILSGIVERCKGAPPLTVLDCTCGIGTQAIGFALLGYTVVATDVSPAAIERARREAKSFNAAITFEVADVRALAECVEGTFDVVLSIDNALAHMLTDGDLQRAATGIAAKLAPDGVLLASLRDYDQLLQDKPRSMQPHVHDEADARYVSFQVWDWGGDGQTYTLNHYIMKQVDGVCETTRRAAQLRAWRRIEITLALRLAGLTAIQWLMPENTGFYQPIVTARKPA